MAPLCPSPPSWQAEAVWSGLPQRDFQSTLRPRWQHAAWIKDTWVNYIVHYTDGDGRQRDGIAMTSGATGATLLHGGLFEYKNGSKQALKPSGHQRSHREAYP
jgi:hypothetical protein